MSIFHCLGHSILLPTCLTLKVEEHALSAVRNCLSNVFAATLYIWRHFPPSTTWGHTMPWWQGIHLTWKWSNMIKKKIQQFVSNLKCKI
jgi:hypothetical protein